MKYHSAFSGLRVKRHRKEGEAVTEREDGRWNLGEKVGTQKLDGSRGRAMEMTISLWLIKFESLHNHHQRISLIPTYMQCHNNDSCTLVKLINLEFV